ncbi:MAG: sulfotransferase family 2 domain-containing protein [Acetobacteraceae bacterium]
MLISLSHRFVFVANVKTASTSIEAALRPYTEIAISETRFGKHIGLAEIEKRFDFIFRKQPLSSFFVFAVVRDPVDMLVSVYSSHHKPEFKGERHYTGDLTFDQFLETFRQRQSWQLVPQAQRLRDRTGRLHMDYIIDFDRLPAQFDEVLSLIGLPPTALPTFNESPDVMSVADVPAETRARIAEDYKRDYRILRLMAGRWLRAPEPGTGPDAPAAMEARP